MNFSRALGFSVMLYVFGAIILLLSGYRPFAMPSLFSYILLWVLMIPLVLFAAKWYFRTVMPTAKQGLLLGVMLLVVGFIFDTAIAIFLGGDLYLTSFYVNLYGDWRFVALAVELLLLTTYAGYEFDSTYTSGKIE